MWLDGSGEVVLCKVLQWSGLEENIHGGEALPVCLRGPGEVL